MKKPKLIKYPHTSKMSIKEWRQFADNVSNQDWNDSVKDYLEECMGESFSNLIIDAFDWEGSPQGHKYWNNISNR